MDVILIALIIIVILVIILVLIEKKSPKIDETFQVDVGRDFYIYNYLNFPVIIKIENENTLEIARKNRLGLSDLYVAENLRTGSDIKIFVKMDEDLIHYSDYKLNVKHDLTIKSLHIGMITSRWVGANFDDKMIPANAQQGRPWVKIHNMTNIPLEINRENITQYGDILYKGRHHFGVALGTIFNDKDKIFQTFKFDTPATDIYYGVVSDIQQPLFGGWQIDDRFDDDPQEPHFLMENGFIGGPPEKTINPNFIPRDGSEISLADRWNEVI